MCMNSCEQIVNQKNYNLNDNKEYVIFLTSKLIIYFTDTSHQEQNPNQPLIY